MNLQKKIIKGHKMVSNPNPKILVIGDLMIDTWVYGDVNRLSPEAPIPILDVKRKTYALGGAGNVLVNLNALGAESMIIGGVSETKDGHMTKRMVNSICDKNAFYFNIPESFKKQRICGSNQQIVRIDYGEGAEISNEEVDGYFKKLEGKVDIVLIADYGKGAVTEYLLSAVSDFCNREKIKLLIDPYIKDYYLKGAFYCTMIKLNKSEAESFTKMNINTEEDIKKAGHILLSIFDSESILITLGPNGMAYFDRNKFKDEPNRRIDNPLHVYDVCGAGDVVFSVLGYIMTDKRMYVNDIMRYATKAGKLAVSKKGTSVITYDELFRIN
jgi:D-beta-D-heptose 7-phosphate kinase/D-beta-D-heptose 1-phosphate adenosyltransferase